MPTTVIVDDGTQIWQERERDRSIRSFSPLPPPSNTTCPTSGLSYYGCSCGNHRCGHCGRRQRDQQRSEGMYGARFTCPCRQTHQREVWQFAVEVEQKDSHYGRS